MACKLILKFKDTVISEIPLDREETTIGRKPENTIHVDNLAVSGRHARVLKIGNKAILEDLGSTNGTFVNDKQITKHILQHGDSIVIGKHLLTFVSLEDKPVVAAPEPEPEEDDMDKTMVITPQARSAMISKSGGSPSAAAAMPLAGLQIIAGPLAGKSMELTASLTSLGKGENCRIKIKGFTVGKQAAVITRRPTGYHIAHLEGLAKSKVNGEAVGDQPRTLKDGDIIELGDTKIEFYIKSK
ncbi:MAG: FHA domain-containing protein [Mariprofundaceae bacterium]|nr:FHA domain-containing protein [Mariprofundaceae bacterium]